MRVPRTAIVVETPVALSETFIKAHIERLPGVCGVIHRDGLIPSVDGRPALSQSISARAFRKLARRVRGRDWSWELTAGGVAAVRKLKADVVLAEYGPAGVGVMDACSLAGVPLVVVFHGYDASKVDAIEAHRKSYPMLFQQAAAIVAVSNAMSAALLDLGCPEEKLVVSPYGVDNEAFCKSPTASSGTDFLAVGRLVEKKAPHLLLLAFARVLEECPNARLRIIGEGDLWGVCTDIIEALGLGRSVQLLGARNHAAVAREMGSACIFVQHSVVAASGDSEGTPVAILEAGASGLPVIATRHAGIPDVVVDGETGLLVDERDVPGMAAAMVRLAKDSASASELGRNARERVATLYTLNQSIERLARVIDAVARGDSVRAVHESIQSQLACRRPVNT